MHKTSDISRSLLACLPCSLLESTFVGSGTSAATASVETTSTSLKILLLLLVRSSLALFGKVSGVLDDLEALVFLIKNLLSSSGGCPLLSLDWHIQECSTDEIADPANPLTLVVGLIQFPVELI